MLLNYINALIRKCGGVARLLPEGSHLAGGSSLPHLLTRAAGCLTALAGGSCRGSTVINAAALAGAGAGSVQGIRGERRPPVS